MTMAEKLRIHQEIERENEAHWEAGKKDVRKAKFLYAERNRWMTILWYEYRGWKYTVNTGLYTPTAAQHRMEQASIDAAIEREERQKEYEATHPYRYEDTAQAGFDLFWAYVNGEITEEELG